MKIKSNFLAIAFTFLLIGNANADANKTPPLDFDSYAVEVAKDIPPKKIILATPLARKYKTIITTDGTKEANFAGHSRVVTWGCGTDCRGFAVFNKKTGVAYTLPGVWSVVGITDNDDDRLSFKLDSRLLVITGGVNETDYGKFYYYWNDKQLKLLHKDVLIDPLK